MDITELTEKAVMLAGKDEKLREKMKDTTTSIVMALKNGDDTFLTFSINSGELKFSNEKLDNPDFMFEISKENFTKLMTGKAHGMILMATKEVSNFELIGSTPDRTVIKRTAGLIARYLEKTRQDYRKRIVYARGSYLESMKMACELSGVSVDEILTPGDLVCLKKLGIRWMKIGLRMDECFTIFKKRIVELTRNNERQTEIIGWTD